jgi:hemin uptake protein HemP
LRVLFANTVRSMEMNGGEEEEKTGNINDLESVSTPGARRLTIIDNRVESRDLFAGTRDIVIVHGNDAYHLRLTAQNKLILTK